MSWVDENRSWFESYVRLLADNMGLKDWRIEIDSRSPDVETAEMQVWRAEELPLAEILGNQ